MSKKRLLNTAIIISGLLIVALQVIISQSFSNHTGTDDQSVDIINEITPDYEPWVGNVWEHTNDLAEPVLFAFQAFLGLSIIIFYILKQRNKIKTA